MPTRDNNIDIINDPIKRAQDMFREQLDSALEQFAPKPVQSPLVKAVHEAGMTMKELREE